MRAGSGAASAICVLVRLQPHDADRQRAVRACDARRLIAGSLTRSSMRPRWSPDGRTIAVERHRLGALPEIVLVDVATKAVRVVAVGAGHWFVMPAWRPGRRRDRRRGGARR